MSEGRKVEGARRQQTQQLAGLWTSMFLDWNCETQNVTSEEKPVPMFCCLYLPLVPLLHPHTHTHTHTHTLSLSQWAAAVGVLISISYWTGLYGEGHIKSVLSLLSLPHLGETPQLHHFFLYPPMSATYFTESQLTTCTSLGWWYTRKKHTSRAFAASLLLNQNAWENKQFTMRNQWVTDREKGNQNRTYSL